MGVMGSIKAGRQDNETCCLNNEKKPPANNEKKQRERKTPAEDPLPCLECWSPVFWRSIYGGPLRCAVCDPWPAEAFVGERWDLLTFPGDRLAWSRPGDDLGRLDGNVVDRLLVYETTDDEGGWTTLECAPP